MAFAYATTNILAEYAPATFTVASGPSDDTRAYLCDGHMDKLFSCTARASNNNIIIDFGSAKSLVGFAILNHNLASIASSGTVNVLVLGADNAGMSTNVVTFNAVPLPTSALTAPAQKDLVFQFAATSRRYWQIYFEWTGTQSLTIGELFPYSTVTQLTRGETDGGGESEAYVLATAQMAYGQQRAAVLAGPIRTKHLKSPDSLTTAERRELATLWRTVVGPVTAFLWIERYEAVAAEGTCTYFDCIFGNLMLPEFAWSWSDYNLSSPPELVIQSRAREVGS